MQQIREIKAALTPSNRGNASVDMNPVPSGSKVAQACLNLRISSLLTIDNPLLLWYTYEKLSKIKDTNMLTKIYILRIFQDMNRIRAHVALPQSLFKNFSSRTHLGYVIVAKSSMILFHASPQLIRKSRIRALGTSRKLRLPVSILPKRVRPNVCVRAMA